MVMHAQSNFLNSIKEGSEIAGKINHTSDEQNKKYEFSSRLSIGSRGGEVRQLQLKLKRMGLFEYHTATGYFGPITKKAVTAYQNKHNLTPTGVVDSATRQKLSNSD